MRDPRFEEARVLCGLEQGESLDLLRNRYTSRVEDARDRLAAALTEEDRQLADDDMRQLREAHDYIQREIDSCPRIAPTSKIEITWRVKGEQGSELGPFVTEDMERQIAGGEIHGGTPIALGAMGLWTAASTHPQLTKAFTAATARRALDAAVRRKPLLKLRIGYVLVLVAALLNLWVPLLGAAVAIFSLLFLAREQREWKDEAEAVGHLLGTGALVQFFLTGVVTLGGSLGYHGAVLLVTALSVAVGLARLETRKRQF